MGAKTSRLREAAEMGSAEEALWELYGRKVAGVERASCYGDFYAGPLEEAELRSEAASVLLLGQYSVGKTSMVSYLLDGATYPGATVGPEPTTDVFVFVEACKGSAESAAVPGPSLVARKDFPFKGLSRFGADFLNKVRGASLPAPLLKNIVFVDTPGILSGEKQRTQRGYDFHQVVHFLASKVDRIWVLFDTSKTDISDEFKMVLAKLQGNDEKIRIILNKADAVTPEELVRVRGALMWNLGKILLSPEVPQVLLGSFWSEPLQRTELREGIQRDLAVLLSDLRALPKGTTARKINDVVKRAKDVRIHALVVDGILRKRPIVCAPCYSRQDLVRKWTQPRLLRLLYARLELSHNVHSRDFPEAEDFAQAAQRTLLPRWRKLQPKDLDALDSFLLDDIPVILTLAARVPALSPAVSPAPSPAATGASGQPPLASPATLGDHSHTPARASAEVPVQATPQATPQTTPQAGPLDSPPSSNSKSRSRADAATASHKPSAAQAAL